MTISNSPFTICRRAIAASGVVLALLACSGGSIIDENPVGTNGLESVAGPGAPSAPMQSAPSIEGGASHPSAVFKGGIPAAGCDPSVAGLIGRTPLRRLSKEEYDNTVRDLFGFEEGFNPSKDFPADGTAGPFPSNAIGSVTGDLTLRFQQAAEQIAAAVAPRLPSLLPCAANGDAACAETFVQTFGRKAYRRPLRPETVTGLMGVYTAGTEGGGFTDGIRLVVEALLQSPDFLYHIETKPSTPGITPLPPYEMAERLSYFLWRTMPDDSLYQAADAGRLKTEEGLRAEAARMIRDPKADVAIASFTDHWLGLSTAAAVQRDPAQFPAFKPGFGEAARRETIRFVDYVMRNQESDGSLKTLMTANFSFPEEAVWEAYGITKPPAGYNGRTPLELPGDRAGVITQVSTLTVHSAATVSPIKRGVYVLNDLLCRNIQLPNNTDIPPPPPPKPGQSVRERLESHTREPNCMPCHVKINPIGFALEGYDQIGRQVMNDDLGQPVNDMSVLMLGDPTVDGPIKGAVELADRVLRSDSGRACIIEQLHRFALGRQEVREDTCSFVTMAQNFAKSGDNVRDLLLDIVTADTFRFQPGS